jgi:hypothetical protein
MQSPSKFQIENQTAVMQDELVSQIHDRILDQNNLDLAHSYNQSCVEIAELYRALEMLERASSSGFVRVKRKADS